jgi:uncharacterized protein YcgI (DUF1989 family)
MRYLFLFNAEKLDEERQQELNALQTTTANHPSLGHQGLLPLVLG